MTWTPAMQLSELKNKSRETMTIHGAKVLLIWHNEEVHAIQAQCPHLNLPLAKGCIEGDDTIVCPFHKSAFNMKTGEVKSWSPWPKIIGPLLGKCKKSHELRVYPTRIENDQILINISESGI